jgi:methyltransferase (TIGR00027 family)
VSKFVARELLGYTANITELRTGKFMSIDLGKSTNKGTALVKLAHQFQSQILFKDEYISWFFDEAVVRYLQEQPWSIDAEPKDDIEKFYRNSYWYIVLREKHGDDAIEAAIASGCKQILLLGSGYDTRFFRLPSIKENSISTFEIDLPKTIEDKRESLIRKLGVIPQGLSLIPLDFNQDNLSSLSAYGFDNAIPTAYIWQGVSYYLPKESVSNFLDFIQSQMAAGSVFVFDCCSPLMTFKNDRVPGIAYQIDKLNEIGEPFQFGMYSNEMETWLREKGFQDIQILQQDDLEAEFLHRRTLPNNMWYVVTVKA